MRDFLKRLFEDRNRQVEVILLDDSRPGMDNSFRLRPRNLFLLLISLSLILTVIVLIAFMFTPLGALLYSEDEQQIRDELTQIANRISDLQDSLEVRDIQLRDIKTVIRLNQDTVLTLDPRLSNNLIGELSSDFEGNRSINYNSALLSLEAGDFMAIQKLENVPEFPARFPVQGTITRGFEPESKHYGIDIATKENGEIYNIADGTVISSGWTINYGYVLSVQHADGLIAIYKHCSKLLKQEGEKVTVGEMIALTGDTGIESSGPHLHFEVWRNGIPQNPLLFLIQ